jgi:hypothetical protein
MPKARSGLAADCEKSDFALFVKVGMAPYWPSVSGEGSWMG